MIKLKDHWRATDEYERMMRASGVVVLNEQNANGEVCIQGVNSVQELAAKLHWMDPYWFDHLLSHFPDEEFTKFTRKDALALQVLQKQAAKEDDGYPVPTIERPLLWPVNNLVLSELSNLQDNLSELGIDQVLIGTEIEFLPSEEPVLGIDTWQKKKELFLTDLVQKINSADPAIQDELITKRDAVKEFNALEVMMYDLVEHDDRTSALLEPIFGKSRDGDGYYDGEGVLELKLSPVLPEQQVENRKTILGVLYEKATEYGLIFEGAPSYHLNFSFWKNGNNVFDPDNPEFLVEGKAILEGITAAVHDFIPTLIKPRYLDMDCESNTCLTVDRSNFLRYASGRVELRPMLDGEIQDTESYLAVVLAGAVNGLKGVDLNLIPATQVKRPKLSHKSDQYKVTNHVLSNSTIDEDGFLSPPEDYILENAETLAFELGMIDTSPESLDNMIGLDLLIVLPPIYAPYLVDFFRATRVDAASGEMLFPETAIDTYEIKTPKSYAHLLSGDLKERKKVIDAINKENISSGRPGSAYDPRFEYAAFREVFENGLFAEAVRDPANVKEIFQIDLQPLRQNIRLLDLMPSFEVRPGYDANAISNHSASAQPLLETRLNRTMTSNALKETGEAFQWSVKDTIIREYPEVLMSQRIAEQPNLIPFR